MTSITYGLTKTEYEYNGKKRVSYGIAVYADAQSEDTAIVVDSISDITPDKAALTELAEQCNSLELSKEHLREIVEDFITRC